MSWPIVDIVSQWDFDPDRVSIPFLRSHLSCWWYLPTQISKFELLGFGFRVIGIQVSAVYAML
jgi:hypothetical protein